MGKLSVPFSTINKIVELRSQERFSNVPLYTYAEIGEIVGLPEHKVRRLWYHHGPGLAALAEVNPNSIPLQMRSAILWNWPPYRGRKKSKNTGSMMSIYCTQKGCPHFDICNTVVHEGYCIGCEVPLRKEIIEETSGKEKP